MGQEQIPAIKSKERERKNTEQRRKSKVLPRGRRHHLPQARLQARCIIWALGNETKVRIPSNEYHLPILSRVSSNLGPAPRSQFNLNYIP